MTAHKKTVWTEKLMQLAVSLVGQLQTDNAEKERRRFAVFNRTWEVASSDQKVALAVAFLGGSK